MKLKLFFLLIVLFSLNAHAQSPGKILKQAEKSLGGAKTLQSVKSHRKSGTITRLMDGSKGKYAEQAFEPNLYNINYDLDGFENEKGFNGKSGWQRDSRDGMQTLTGDESRDFQAEAFYRNALWLDYKKEKAKIVSGGRVDLNGKSANIVLLTTAKGVPIKLYFDSTTYLPVREEFPAGDKHKIFDYGDYRTIDKVKYPFL